MKLVFLISVIAWTGLWLTPDQLGQWHYKRGNHTKAAEHFRDPMWQATAWYRAGEFTKAANAFGRRDSAEAHYNQGNSWLMCGAYETAIACYDRALQRKPGWTDAIENKAIAEARAKRVDHKGQDMGDQDLGADKVVFDKDANNEGQETEISGSAAMSDQDIQSIWLRRIQTSPADFLKAKFAYQQAVESEGGSE